MNTINIAIDFTKGTNKISGISLITGDYASTKINFTFDREDGTKIFEMKNPSDQIVYAGEIVNNEVILAGEENGQNFSIFNEEGLYIYEISLYVGDSKLTSTKGQLPVKKEQVIIGDETIEPYLPIFDQLMQDISSAITETNNLNITAEKVDTTTTIEITDKQGQTTTIEILDGEKGDKGDKGDAGAIKMLIVNELPSTGADDTIYLVPLDNPDLQGNNYAEYVYINGQWELLGKIGVQVDLTDYYTKTETNTLLDNKVGFTDYATDSVAGVFRTSVARNIKVNSNGLLYCDTSSYTDYLNKIDGMFISKGTLENVITGKGLTTKSYVDGLVGDIQTLLDNLDSGSGV